jgi:hypothetical protein
MNQASALSLEISPDSQRQFGPCDCCGNMTSRVWGYIWQNGSAIAAYFVEWTEGHPYREANFDFIYGRWGDETSAKDRQAIAVAYRCLETGPSFMVIDANDRTVGKNSLAGKAVTREQVLNGELRGITFSLCDAVYLSDPRIGTLRP